MSEEEPNPLRDAYLTHVMGMGQVAYMWNDLHEVLGELFALLGARGHGVGMAVWYSTANDRAQRDMLRAVLDTLPEEEWPRYTEDTRDERLAERAAMVEMLEKVNSLADGRNNALHAPFEPRVTVASDGATASIRIAPADFLGHPRAKRLLVVQDLPREFEFYATTAQRLTQYFRTATISLKNGDAAWPETPQIPSLSLKKTR